MAIRLTARYQGAPQGSPPLFERTFQVNRITIGNHPHASLCLNGSVLSAEQVVIVNDSGQPEVINQAEGTSLNGEPLAVNSRRLISSGDLLSIGTYEVRVYVEDDVAFDDGPPANERREFGSAAPKETRTKSFAEILDSLRTDEDRFYFVIEGGKQAGVRVPIDLQETPVGWDQTGEVSFDAISISEFCGIVRKDWSGVIFQAQPGSNVLINNEPLQNGRRLRDGDRVQLSRSSVEAGIVPHVVLVFREPASLVILDSLMPRIRPPLETETQPEAERSSQRKALYEPAGKLAALIKSNREYFGVFTFLEISLMALGTIAGAVLIFLILNYS